MVVTNVARSRGNKNSNYNQGHYECAYIQADIKIKSFCENEYTKCIECPVYHCKEKEMRELMPFNAHCETFPYTINYILEFFNNERGKCSSG